MQRLDSHCLFGERRDQSLGFERFRAQFEDQCAHLGQTSIGKFKDVVQRSQALEGKAQLHQLLFRGRAAAVKKDEIVSLHNKESWLIV